MNTILIVDDLPDLRFILRLALENMGFTCLEASDGEMALRMLSDHPSVALVVTDYEMPRKNGLQLLSCMSAQSTMQHIPKILVTALQSPDLRLKAFQAGAHHVLFKPYDLVALKDCIHTLLARPRAA